MAEQKGSRGGSARAAGLPSVEDVAGRAERLGVTVDRVLEEYRRIAFSSLRDIAEWGPGENGLDVKPSKNLTEAEVAAIAEIVASAKDRRIYRIKMHDKKPVLDAIARHLGMLEKKQDEQTQDDNEDPREFIIREVDRVAAEEELEAGNPESQR